MSTRRFRTGWPPDSILLRPPTLNEWLAADHPAYRWRALVDEWDPSAIYSTYGSKGPPTTRGSWSKSGCMRTPADCGRPAPSNRPVTMTSAFGENAPFFVEIDTSDPDGSWVY